MLEAKDKQTKITNMMKANFKRLLALNTLVLITLTVNPHNDKSAAKRDTSTPTELTQEDGRQWRAGETVSQEAIEAFGGVDKCFVVTPIPDGVWQRMQGKTYKKNPYIGRNDLRYIRVLHWDKDERIHVGEMVCNRLIANRLITILRKLYDAKYPIERMLLPDVYDADDERQMSDNNSSCFCYRTVNGSTKLSKHARGLAVDINPLYNPYCKKRADGTRHIQPAQAAKYCDRSWDFPYKIQRNDLCVSLFLEAGFSWGGSWRTSKDYQHFELRE